MNEYVVKFIDLTDDKDFDDFAGRIDIEKVNSQLFTNNELDRLEGRFDNLPVSITANETGLSLSLFDNDYTDDIVETVKTKLEK